eukprot:scaffold2429_cov165-Amphora_coffeaeformis.AAC.13
MACVRDKDIKMSVRSTAPRKVDIPSQEVLFEYNKKINLRRIRLEVFSVLRQNASQYKVCG